ncbi:MAG: hypothetical protein PW789_08725 [Edaphobacter sp.]|uniref:hypothetical protein n=1 Tax=Edaphobacter sp. TaxID=1934404 RepID=UPI00238651B4|nr:hypothetical protein [Edaphobacter sp.]MDE1176679.1 hypothetical protein [Edaphobacter sp.]
MENLRLVVPAVVAVSIPYIGRWRANAWLRSQQQEEEIEQTERGRNQGIALTESA